MTRVTLILALLAAAVVSALPVNPASGRIKLVTLPVRSRVEVQLDNPDATLVEEERVVNLLEGTNHIDFSWANTRIDKDTIVFRPLVDDEKVRIIHVAYPPGEDALVWEVYSEESMPVRIRVSYLIGNLDRTFNYRATVNHEETSLTLRNYMRLRNFSGERFGEDVGIWAGFGVYFRRPLGMTESRQLLLARFTDVPVEKKFVFNWRTGQEVPDEPYQRYVAMHYVLRNDTDHGLGEFPLQPGKVRIFQQDGRGGEAFLGEDWGQFTPIDDRMELYLGLARDVQVERTIDFRDRHNVKGNARNHEVVLKYVVSNYRTEATTLNIEEDLRALRDELIGRKNRIPDWTLNDRTTDPEKVERVSAEALEVHLPLPAAPEAADDEVEEITFRVHVTFRNEW